MKIFEENIDPNKAARKKEMALLIPTFLVFILVVIHLITATGNIPAWGQAYFWLSPLAVVYHAFLLRWLWRRPMPRWLKVTEISLVVLALIPQLIAAYIVIRVLPQMHHHVGPPPAH
jgi:hypothetical protein